VKRLLIMLVCIIVFFVNGCAATAQLTQYTASPASEIIAIKTPNIDKNADLDDLIIPSYLPQKLSGGNDIYQPSLSKNGDKATITSGGVTLVVLYYTEATESFPEGGKAELTAQDGNYTLRMRLNLNTACTLKSEGISRNELIKVAESFYLEMGPAQDTVTNAASSDKRELELAIAKMSDTDRTEIEVTLEGYTWDEMMTAFKSAYPKECEICAAEDSRDPSTPCPNPDEAQSAVELRARFCQEDFFTKKLNAFRQKYNVYGEDYIMGSYGNTQEAPACQLWADKSTILKMLNDKDITDVHLLPPLEELDD
jgi:hypothetical protein